MNSLPRDIKADVLLASISGGTDIIACFMGENSTLPVYRGEIQVYQCFDVGQFQMKMENYSEVNLAAELSSSPSAIS